jgi:hypothetical protein
LEGLEDIAAMPHPKNHLKLTGDTHLPDIDDFAADEAGGSPVYADGWTPAEDTVQHDIVAPQKAGPMHRQDSTPWLLIGAGLAFGALVVRMLRR